jgi:16S rRNA processing protein RimM
MTPYIRIGVISSSHGVKGDAKIYPTTDDIYRFDRLKYCFLENKGEMIRLDVTRVKYVKGMPVVGFAQFASIDDVMRFKNADLYVPREEADPLDEDEYYIADLIGMQVVTDQGQVLGTLIDVMETGSNDVYIVKTEDDREVLLPAIRDCVQDIDTDQNVMTVHIMPGLID